jgi:Rieske Fe-S protein
MDVRDDRRAAAGECGVTRRAVLGAAAGLTVLGALGGCGVLGKKEEKVPAIMTGVVNIGAGTEYRAGTAAVKYWETYGFVVANDGGTVVAIRPRCSHRGCLANWHPEHLSYECPCHGSMYDLIGRVIKGPALKPLPAVVCVKQADGTLTVDLDKLYAAEAGLGVKVEYKKG